MPRSSPAPRASASLTSGGALVSFVTLSLFGAPARAEDPHAAEIRAFARVMATARTVRESCPDIEPDDRFLEALRQRLHIVEADHDVFAPEAHCAAEVLKRALADAPSRQAWCDAAFRLYGPEGTLIRGMLQKPFAPR